MSTPTIADRVRGKVATIVGTLGPALAAVVVREALGLRSDAPVEALPEPTEAHLDALAEVGGTLWALTRSGITEPEALASYALTTRTLDLVHPHDAAEYARMLHDGWVMLTDEAVTGDRGGRHVIAEQPSGEYVLTHSCIAGPRTVGWLARDIYPR